MSSWMTSGKARLNARQNRTFEKRAQQRARVMTAAGNNGTSATEQPKRILRERGHPNANYQAEAARGTKRHRSDNIEIISGERAKAKYSPNNPIRRRGVVATARRIPHPHSLDQHRQWRSQPRPPHGAEYHPHHGAPPPHGHEYHPQHGPPHPPPYNPHRPEYNYEHHPHHYPAHVSREEHSRRYYHHSGQREGPHMERSHHFPEHAQYRAAPYFPPSADRQAMTYDYKTAQWVPCRNPPRQHPPPQHAYEPPDPIKEAQVYPSAHQPLLEDYHHDPQHHQGGGGYPIRQSNHPKPPFQGRQLPPHLQQRSASDWEESTIRRSRKHGEDDYLYYGDPPSVNLETSASFEMPTGSDENIFHDPHHHHSSSTSRRQPHLYDHDVDGAATLTRADMDKHNVYSNDPPDWHHEPPPKHAVEPPPLGYDHHHHHVGYPELEGPSANTDDDFPEVKYSKSEVEPWDAPPPPPESTTNHHQFQIERSNNNTTWSPCRSTSSAAEPQSFTLRRTSSSRGRRTSRYVPPRLPYSPPRLPEPDAGGGGGGLARFQNKKRRTMSPARLDNDTTTTAITAAAAAPEVVVGDENAAAEATTLSTPAFFDNGVQINEDGTPFTAADAASAEDASSAATD